MFIRDHLTGHAPIAPAVPIWYGGIGPDARERFLLLSLVLLLSRMWLALSPGGGSLEDPRLSRMYWKLFLNNVERKLGGLGKKNLMRSGMVTGLLIALLVAGASLAYWENGRGNLHKIEQHLQTTEQQEVTPPRPGGQDPVVLSRTAIPGGRHAGVPFGDPSARTRHGCFADLGLPAG